MKRVLLVLMVLSLDVSAKLPLQIGYFSLVLIDQNCGGQNVVPNLRIGQIGGNAPYTVTLNTNGPDSVSLNCSRFFTDSKFSDQNTVLISDFFNTQTTALFTNNNKLKSSITRIEAIFKLTCTGVSVSLSETFQQRFLIDSVTLSHEGKTTNYPVGAYNCFAGSCSTLQNIVDLLPGHYTLIITPKTNQGACDTPFVMTFEITHTPLSLGSVIARPSCGSSGSLAVNALGGNGPYTFTYQDKNNSANKGSSGPINEANYTFTGLSAGIYEIAVSDTPIQLTDNCVGNYYEGCTVFDTKKIRGNCGFIRCCRN